MLSFLGALYLVAAAFVAPLLLAMRRLGLGGGTLLANRWHAEELSSTNFQVAMMAADDGGASGQNKNMKTGPKPKAKQQQPGRRPCEGGIHKYLPHCDASLSRKERTKLLIDVLSPEEKISLLGHDSPIIDRPGIIYLPAYKWWNEGLHGMAWTDCCPPFKWNNVTVFPQVMGLGTTWNRTLWSKIGDAIGAEAIRKIHNRANNPTTTNNNADDVHDDDVHPGLTYFTPNINIFRDPRWGRGQETPGEDPYLTSHYAAIMVMSLQYGNEYAMQFLDEGGGGKDHGEDAGVDAAAPPPNGGGSDGRQRPWMLRPRVAATCKHFAAYSLETNRMNFSAEIHDSRDWEDTYLPAFNACVHAERFLIDEFFHDDDDNGNVSGSPGEDNDGRRRQHRHHHRRASIGGAVGVMCSYNSVNGIPSCANAELLRGRLRREWDFPGYIVSDCWAIANLLEGHRYAGSYEEAVGMALRAGVDLDCGDTIQGYGMAALEGGYVDIDDVDGALANLFGVLIDLGYFDERRSDDGVDVGGESLEVYHNQLALEAALQSIVLLKNGPSGETTPSREAPLPLGTEHGRINLIGPLADDGDILLGNYNGIPSDVITPLRGLRDLGIKVDYDRGCHVTDGPDAQNRHHFSNGTLLCKRMSADSDATILVMGLNQSIESEDLDRTSLLLPEVQRDAIEEATRCSRAKSPGAPVILVVISGGPVDLSSYKSDDRVDAILYTGYPGQAGGKALSHVLYGKYNPSARLTTTMYHNSYIKKVELGDMKMRPVGDPATLVGEHDENSVYPGRTYRFFNGQAVYPFGHGLSYSSWEYSIHPETTGNDTGGVSGNLISYIDVDVSNTGPMDGSNSVLLFHAGPNAGRGGNPIKSLVGFEKVFVPAGGTLRTTFHVKKWMGSQRDGVHLFMVGPYMDHTVQVNTLVDG